MPQSPLGNRCTGIGKNGRGFVEIAEDARLGHGEMKILEDRAPRRSRPWLALLTPAPAAQPFGIDMAVRKEAARLGLAAVMHAVGSADRLGAARTGLRLFPETLECEVHARGLTAIRWAAEVDHRWSQADRRHRTDCGEAILKR